jgi:hypothetical protein
MYIQFSATCFMLSISSAVSSSHALVQSLFVSRHGVRSPYPPRYGTVSDYTAYTDKIFPTNTSWGMAYSDFASQHLTPHGESIIPFMGTYAAQRYAQDGLDLSDCANIACYVDDSSRDITTGILWLQGMGCPDVAVNIVNSTSYPELQPVVQDEFETECVVATESQVDGLYGGDPETYAHLYENQIQTVMDVIEMPDDAEICALANPDYVPSPVCTLFDTGYNWTGKVYDGCFKGPVYYSRYFAEYFMLQYLSNVSDWGFGKLTPALLNDLYAMQVANLWFGTNYW